MKRRIYLAGLIVATAIAMEPLATRLTAFATNGHTWGVKQVPDYINPANKYMSDTSAVAGITSAASTWRGVANISLAYAGYTDKSSLTNDGVNAVFFRDDSSGYIAEAYWWWDGSGRLVDADIVYHENYKFYSGNMGCNGDGYYIENTGSHEFGHLLGLAHSSVDTAAMWAYSGACETIRETLDPDDIAGLQSLYPGSTTSTTAPSAPSGLTAAAGSASPTSSVAMSWADNATNETGYVVERSSDGATFSQRAQLGAGATSYLDSGLASGATYYYRVSAYNSAGSSGYSNVASGQTQAADRNADRPERAIRAHCRSRARRARRAASRCPGLTTRRTKRATSWNAAPTARPSRNARSSGQAQPPILIAASRPALPITIACPHTTALAPRGTRTSRPAKHKPLPQRRPPRTRHQGSLPQRARRARRAASRCPGLTTRRTKRGTWWNAAPTARPSRNARSSGQAQPPILTAASRPALPITIACPHTTALAPRRTRTSRPAKRRLRRPLRHRPRRPRPRPRIRHRPTERPGSTGASRSGGQGPTPRVTTCI